MSTPTGVQQTALAEAYNPATGAWAAVAPMTTPRSWHVATSLADGRVVVAGGNPYPYRTAEIFTP